MTYSLQVSLDTWRFLLTEEVAIGTSPHLGDILYAIEELRNPGIGELLNP